MINILNRWFRCLRTWFWWILSKFNVITPARVKHIFLAAKLFVQAYWSRCTTRSRGEWVKNPSRIWLRKSVRESEIALDYDKRIRPVPFVATRKNGIPSMAECSRGRNGKSRHPTMNDCDVSCLSVYVSDSVSDDWWAREFWDFFPLRSVLMLSEWSVKMVICNRVATRSRELS